ncbi:MULTISPECIES: GAF and ANTAR domain-containing protein [Cryobacterium]|uniref:GAF and ANTAR domain-containing protein n=1 Tax=Cryobacterium TaxID=69578 RepID=UPI000CD441A2|nr:MULTISPECIES: GAF and ANTAR domain-containing protein [Cryobacterium]POH65128.1 transcriptional regulator [Cryobacterium zongtaii]TFC44751.1 ANTAR domain-containing protein [Cryobacterium sp. TMN-39-2]TFC90474.1 ANTAR domain-containing protein [Cryobacterium sp. TMT4-31]
MNETTRLELLFDAFATFADTLVVGYDVLELLQTLVETCRDLLDVDSAGILLANAADKLEVVASTSEANTLVEVMQIDADAGPCLECFRTRAVVSLPDIDVGSSRWAAFCETARSQGIHSVYAIPLRLRETTIGTLNLMRNERGELNQYDIRAAQALADVATIGILQERTIRDASTLRDQLQKALSSRIIIEQAKGVVAETANVSIEAAFDLIRRHARSHQTSLTLVAQSLVTRELSL